jgi:hypothetical protein
MHADDQSKLEDDLQRALYSLHNTTKQFGMKISSILKCDG